MLPTSLSSGGCAGPVLLLSLRVQLARGVAPPPAAQTDDPAPARLPPLLLGAVPQVKKQNYHFQDVAIISSSFRLLLLVLTSVLALAWIILITILIVVIETKLGGVQELEVNLEMKREKVKEEAEAEREDGELLGHLKDE